MALLLFILFICQIAFAEQIIVDDIIIEGNAPNGVLAKEIALKSGTKNLLEKIVTDFYPNAKYSSLNGINLHSLRNSVVGYSIYDERSDLHSYSARIRYILDYEQVKPIVREIEANIRLKKYLIIPLKCNDTCSIDEEILPEFTDRAREYKNIKLISGDAMQELADDYNNEELDLFREKVLIENGADELVLVLSKQIGFEIISSSGRSNCDNSVIDETLEFISNPISSVKIRSNPRIIHCVVRDLKNWKQIRDFLNSNFKYIVKSVENDSITLDIYYEKDIDTFFKIAKKNRIELIDSNYLLELVV